MVTGTMRMWSSGSSAIVQIVVLLLSFLRASPSCPPQTDTNMLFLGERSYQRGSSDGAPHDWMPDDKDGWIVPPTGSFPPMISIQAANRQHVCSGVLISCRYILTAANCIDEVGPNPIVVIGPNKRSDDRWTEGVWELRAEMAHVHPNWMGQVERGYDIALLRLPKELHIPMPILATSSFRLYPNMRVYGFQLMNNLEVSQFRIVVNDLCPQLKGLVADMFCVHSMWANMGEGSSGSPIVITNNDVKWVNQVGYMLLGIVSHANTTSLQDSGTGCVRVNEVHDWIEHVLSQQSDMISSVHSVIFVAMVAFVLTIVIYFLPHVPWWVFMLLSLFELALLVFMLMLWAQIAQISFPEYQYFIKSIWRDLWSINEPLSVMLFTIAFIAGAIVMLWQYKVLVMAGHPSEIMLPSNGQSRQHF